MPKDIKLSSLLQEKLINLELRGKNKKEIIEELVDLVARSSKLKNKKAFLKAILERERLGSTGVGNGVAIPHAKSKVVKNFVLVFGRKDSGIDFGALDGERTYLFFSLASPEEEVGGHLKVLSEIARLIKDKFIVDSLRGVRTKKDVIRVLALYGNSK